MPPFLPASHSTSAAQSFSQLDQFLENRVLEGGHATRHSTTHSGSRSAKSLCKVKPQCSGNTACTLACSCVSCSALITLAILVPLIVIISITLLVFYIRRRKRQKTRTQFRSTESVLPVEFLNLKQNQSPDAYSPTLDKESTPCEPDARGIQPDASPAVRVAVGNHTHNSNSDLGSNYYDNNKNQTRADVEVALRPIKEDVLEEHQKQRDFDVVSSSQSKIKHDHLHHKHEPKQFVTNEDPAKGTDKESDF